MNKNNDDNTNNSNDNYDSNTPIIIFTNMLRNMINSYTV